MAAYFELAFARRRGRRAAAKSYTDTEYFGDFDEARQRARQLHANRAEELVVGAIDLRRIETLEVYAL